MTSSKSSTKKVAGLSVFAVSMITITSVDSIRNLPGSATLGSQAIFFFLIAAILFFIPVGLVCAELTTMFPEQGGVYLWGKKAFGENFGFIALWYQFAENLVFYPTLLIFILATLFYPFSQHASNDPKLMFIAINIVFWGVTLLNFFGLKISAIFTEVMGLLGTILPMILICGVGLFWFLTKGDLNQISLNLHTLLPVFSSNTLSITFTSVVLSLTGMEIATVYANEVKNPQKSYPKALLIAAIFIMITLTLGSLAISTVIGPQSSTLNLGVMQFFTEFFRVIHMPFMTVVIAFCIVLGGLASLNNWIIAPLKGLSSSAKDGFFSERFKRENKHQAPVFMLVVQGIVVSALSSIFIFIPSVNEGMWLLNILMTQLYMIMYITIFISFIVVRYKFPTLTRPFKVPGGNIVAWIVSFFGLLASSGTILISFKPDPSVGIAEPYLFIVALFIGLFIFSVPALFAMVYRQKRLNQENLTQ
ncbi:MAG: APC family permease [Fusobacteria bacterium]|nr:APC family permease [Fusobacteriota bacterium]